MNGDTVDVSIFMSLHLGDLMRETAHLSPAEMGSHMRLLMAGWSRDGYLPDKQDSLQRLAVADAADWPAIWSTIRDLWCPTEDCRLFHPLLVAWVDRARAARRRSVERGRAGGLAPHPTQRQGDAEIASKASRDGDESEPKRGRDPAEPPDSGLRNPISGSIHQRPDAQGACPTATASGRVRSRRRGVDESGAFLRVWKQYPRHDARARAAEEWARQARNHDGGEVALVEAVTAALDWQVPHWRKTDCKYPTHVPHLSSYLYDRRWTDEPPTATAPASQTWRPARPVNLPSASGNYASDAAADPDRAAATADRTVAADLAARKVAGLIEQVAAAKGAT